MNEDADTLKHQIDELKTSLNLPLPESARSTLERALADLQTRLEQIVTSTNFNALGDNRGQQIALNQGTVQQFFGTTPPAEDKTTLLAAYLTSLTSECQQLRLSRLTSKRQTGADQQATPQLRLQAVYTSLVTDGELLPTVRERRRRVDWLRRLLKRLKLEERAADVVPPMQVRIPQTVFPKDQVHARSAGAMPDAEILAALEPDTLVTFRLLRPELATEAIRTHQRLVLLGEPGAGKSTVLRYLSLLLAQRAQQQPADLPGWNDAYLPVPILCPLGAVAELLRTTQPDPDKALWQAIGDVLDGEQGIRSGLRDHLKDAIRRGGVLLLFDGLDELPTSGDNPRSRIAQALRRFATGDAAQTPMVVTCRVLPYYAGGDWHLPTDEGWQVRTVQPLAFGQVRQFVQQWYAELSLIDPDLSTTVAERRAEQLLTALHASERLQKLIAAPLLLTMLAILHYNRDEIPRDRVKLYEECVVLLLERWEPVRTFTIKRPGLLERLGNLPNLELDMLRGVLHRLAWQVHADPPAADGRGLLDGVRLEGELLRFFKKRYQEYDPAAKVDTMVLVLNEDAGLLQARADDRYAFPHLTFQEYLAACDLADSDNLVQEAYAVWTSADASRWREVLLLMAGRLRWLGVRSAQREGIPWLRHLLRTKLRGGVAKDPVRRARDAALAAVSYQELGAQEVLDEEDLNDLLRDAILDLLATPASGVALEDRLTAARLLADLGDPRYPVTSAEWTTTLHGLTTGSSSDSSSSVLRPSSAPSYWCAVPPGTYRIGGWEAGAEHADITLPGYWITRYPVTVAQYRAFLEAGGYDTQDYWTEQGWQWRRENNITQPWGWDDVQYNSPNQAVIGVSWYESMAFCAWLTAQLAGVLPAGYACCLPTEAEWEAAAAYDAQMQRRTYPWGADEPTAEHAIFEDDQGNSLGAPAPVGICPTGAAACGALDMGGQVWEYCRSSYQAYPQGAHAAEKDFTTGDYAVPLRGGSWYYSRTYVRCGARFGGLPISDDGFRLLLSPRVSS